MKKGCFLLGLIGSILILYGFILAFFKSNVFWYDYFVIGGTLLFGSINYKIGNAGLFALIKNKSINFLKLYISYLIFAILIEIVGRFLLNLWFYPSSSVLDQIIYVFLIGYPFAFFFVYETFVMFNGKIRSKTLAFVFTFIFSAFLHEIPNVFVWSWIYTIPYIKFEIFQINIVVIIGWSILVLVPLLVKRYLKV